MLFRLSPRWETRQLIAASSFILLVACAEKPTAADALPLVRDAAALRFGGQYRLDGLSIQLSSDALLSRGRNSYGGRAELRYSW